MLKRRTQARRRRLSPSCTVLLHRRALCGQRRTLTRKRFLGWGRGVIRRRKDCEFRAIPRVAMDRQSSLRRCSSTKSSTCFIVCFGVLCYPSYCFVSVLLSLRCSASLSNYELRYCSRPWEPGCMSNVLVAVLHPGQNRTPIFLQATLSLITSGMLSRWPEELRFAALFYILIRSIGRSPCCGSFSRCRLPAGRDPVRFYGQRYKTYVVLNRLIVNNL